MKKVMTVCIVRDGSRILLGLKKRGFTAGRWNGFGGKVQPDETVEQAAHRELQEEAGINATTLRPIGLLSFTFTDHDDVHEVHYFEVTDYSGEPAESEEMRPQWFDIADIPYDQMWPDVRVWMSMYLDGKRFGGRMRYQGFDTILEHNLLDHKHDGPTFPHQRG